MTVIQWFYHILIFQFNPSLDLVEDTVRRLFVLRTAICTFNHRIKSLLAG